MMGHHSSDIKSLIKCQFAIVRYRLLLENLKKTANQCAVSFGVLCSFLAAHRRQVRTHFLCFRLGVSYGNVLFYLFIN